VNCENYRLWKVDDAIVRGGICGDPAKWIVSQGTGTLKIPTCENCVIRYQADPMQTGPKRTGFFDNAAKKRFVIALIQEQDGWQTDAK